MLKLIKWDSINFIRKYYWLYLSYAAAILISVIFINQTNFLSFFFDGICTLFGIFFCVYTFSISIIYPINWFRENTALLELSSPASPWKILLGKVTISYCINISGLLLTQLLWFTIKRFGVSGFRFFNSFQVFIEYTICALMLIVFIMFSYITAKSFNFTRNKAKITTVLLTVMIPVLLIFIVLSSFVATDILTYSAADYGQFCLTQNGKMSPFEETCCILVPIVVIVLGFLGSCKLFNTRFERY